MTDIPWLVLMIAVPALGAGVVAGLPKGRDELARQIALGVSLVVLLFAVLATIAFDADGDRFQLTTSVSSIKDFGVSFALGVDGIALVMLLLVGVLVPIVIGSSWNERAGDVAIDRRSMKAFFAWLLLLEAMMIGVFAATDVFLAVRRTSGHSAARSRIACGGSLDRAIPANYPFSSLVPKANGEVSRLEAIARSAHAPARVEIGRRPRHRCRRSRRPLPRPHSAGTSRSGRGPRATTGSSPSPTAHASRSVTCHRRSRLPRQHRRRNPTPFPRAHSRPTPAGSCD